MFGSNKDNSKKNMVCNHCKYEWHHNFSRYEPKYCLMCHSTDIRRMDESFNIHFTTPKHTEKNGKKHLYKMPELQEALIFAAATIIILGIAVHFLL